jgi:DNA-binding NarL/FixJ family response regulator
MQKVQGLTPHQLTILQMKVEGFLIRDIAAELLVTPQDIKNLLGAIYKKIGLSLDPSDNREARKVAIELAYKDYLVQPKRSTETAES